jgi:hypothetical protein
LCNQLAELGLGQECDGIVQHEENVLAAYPANGSSKLVSIDMLAGHGPRFSPVCWLLVYYPILSRAKEPRWDIAVGFAGANVRMSSSPARATKSMCASVARPKSERQAIEDKDHIFGFLEQSHISEKNVARLDHMAKSDNPQVASLAAIVLDIARAKPYKTRRLKFLAHKHPELLSRLRDTGLIFPNNYETWMLSPEEDGLRLTGGS